MVVELSFDEKLQKAIQEAPDHGAYRNGSICRFGWSEGFLVCVEGAWYLVDVEFDGHKELPSFIRSRAEAEQYIDEANQWFISGVAAGRAELKDQLNKLIGN